MADDVERYRPQRMGEGFRVNRYAVERDEDGAVTRRDPIPSPPQPLPLYPREIGLLVEAVVAYEPWRAVDQTLIDVWTAQAQLGRWTFAEAMRAIHTWAQTRTRGEFLDPAEVTRMVKREREDVLSRAAAPAPFTPTPDEKRARGRTTRMNAIFAESGSRLRSGSLDDPTTFDPRGRHVACEGDPANSAGDRGCGVPAGEPCSLRVTDRRKRSVPGGFVHPSRLLRELDFVNAARRERGMRPVPPSVAAPTLPGYARLSRHPDDSTAVRREPEPVTPSPDAD